METENTALTVANDCVISADKNRLKQLFENLFRNAVEHGGKTVTVGTLADGFYISDSGSGIPVDERGQVFNFGYSTTDTGTGFGLKIVSQVVESHDWDICVTEENTGGAQFEITDIEIDS